MKNFLSSTLWRSTVIPGLQAGITGALLGAALGYHTQMNGGPLYSALLLFLIALSVVVFERFFRGSRLRRLRYILVLSLRVSAWFLISVLWSYLVFKLYLDAKFGESAAGGPEYISKISQQFNGYPIFHILIAMLIAGFVFQVRTLLGRGVLFNYVIGTYHKPRVESRIFMFLDITSATTIAEELGPVKYSAFVRDFFHDLDVAITTAQGDVVQYVGDEVVVTWPITKGVRNANCLQAYLEARKLFVARAGRYRDKYGVVPEFKAALHYGDITITEVGASKREIAYHGDTINTTARICSMCHTLQRHILISEQLMELLQLPDTLEGEDMGAHTMKGKAKALRLYSVAVQ